MRTFCFYLLVIFLGLLECMFLFTVTITLIDNETAVWFTFGCIFLEAGGLLIVAQIHVEMKQSGGEKITCDQRLDRGPECNSPALNSWNGNVGFGLLQSHACRHMFTYPSISATVKGRPSLYSSWRAAVGNPWVKTWTVVVTTLQGCSMKYYLGPPCHWECPNSS